MTGLIDRIEGATEGSRELDALVCVALGYHPGFPDHDGYLVPWRIEVDERDEARVAAYLLPPDEGRRMVWSRPAQPVTTSLDAALALAERVLPGQEYEISTLYGVARVTLNLNHGDDGGPYYGSHECGSVPLALCAAILRAKEQGNGEPKSSEPEGRE